MHMSTMALAMLELATVWWHGVPMTLALVTRRQQLAVTSVSVSPFGAGHVAANCTAELSVNVAKLHTTPSFII